MKDLRDPNDPLLNIERNCVNKQKLSKIDDRYG